MRWALSTGVKMDVNGCCHRVGKGKRVAIDTFQCEEGSAQQWHYSIFGRGFPVMTTSFFNQGPTLSTDD
jgi:hypothetical protein